MTRRNIELVLLCLAAPLVLLLFGSLALSQGDDLTWRTFAVPAGLFAAFVVAHIATRLLAPGADPAILPITFALSGIGIAFITRIAPYTNTGSTNMAVNQVVWLFLAIVLMIVVMALFRNPDKLANYKYTIAIIGLALLLSPLLPVVGTEISGSRIWLTVGGFSFQPGELAKVFIVVFLAAYLAQNREMLSVFTWKIGPAHLPDVRTLLPLLFMWGVAMLVIVFEKDLGGAIVVFFVFLTMLYVATGRKFYLVIGIVLIAAGAAGAYVAFDHVQTRVDIWLDPFADADGSGYQLVQTLYALADGGLVGTGIGEGLAGGGNGLVQLAVVESDFIFACIGEEIGLLGAAAVLLLYLCLAIRGYATAARAKSDMSSLLACGLTTVIVLQAFIIVGGVTGLIPLTGITLPFISQGGSSLVSSFIGVGFLLLCGDEATGVNSEVANTTTSLHSGSVLGRVSLGKRLTHVMIVCAVLFAVLVANLTYIMVVKADYYQNLEGNSHTIVKESTSARGTISTSDGVVLAESVETDDGTYERSYPAGDLATHVVGYYSTIYGASGIESSYSDTLAGDENYASWSDVLDSLTGQSETGNDVVLTIDSTIQQAAQDALEGYSGACVVIDPTTGAILAMASSPTYDAADFEEVIAAASEDSSDSSLLNRATGVLYAPGSTFKIVTLATAIEYEVADEDTVYSAPGTLEIGGGDVTNFNSRSYGSITLARATELSSNTVFGQLGVDIGAELLVEGADAFGFDSDFEFPLTLVTSLMPDPDEMTEWQTAWAAAGEPVGQDGPNATVLQMALVGCGIANGGVIMQPYLVDGIYNADGVRSFTAEPTSLTRAVSEDTADRVREVLVGVVESGTGTSAAVDGVTVAGKTGTAENSGKEDNSWFVGMAPAGEDDEPTVVVALVLEEGGSGTAAKKAQNVLETALEVQGVL